MQEQIRNELNLLRLDLRDLLQSSTDDESERLKKLLDKVCLLLGVDKIDD